MYSFRVAEEKKKWNVQLYLIVYPDQKTEKKKWKLKIMYKKKRHIIIQLISVEYQDHNNRTDIFFWGALLLVPLK